MHILLISGNSPLQDALNVALAAAADVTVQQLAELAQLQAALDAQPPDLLLVALPLPAQEALLLLEMPQLRPVIIAGDSPLEALWAAGSTFPYLHVTPDTLDDLVPKLRTLIQSALVSPRNPHKQLLEAFTALTPTLFTEFELEPLLQRIVEEAVAFIPEAEAGSLLLEEGTHFAFRGFVGYAPELRQVKVPVASSFIPKLRQGEVVHVHNIVQTNESDFPAEITEALKQYGRVAEIKETLAAPLLRAGVMIGYLTVDSFKPGTQFTAIDQEALGYLAGIATIAIHNAQLLADERAARTLAETLGELGRQLVASLDVEDVLSQVLDALFLLTPCDAADVLFVADGDAVLAQQRSTGDYSFPPQADFRLNIQQTANLLQAAQQHTPLLTADTRLAPGWITTPETTWLRSHIAAPFYLEQQLAGFLCVSSAQPRKFTQKDCAILAALIPLVAIALHNAGLFREARVARQRAEAAYEDLRRLDAMKSQFIQNVSHELRTPLAIIKGYLDLVLDVTFGFNPEPNIEQALKAMQTHTNRLTGLVESITTLENVETGQLVRQPQPVLPVFVRALQAIRQKVERQRLKLIVDLEAQLPQVNVDPQQLGLALWHLLDNAIKFNRSDGHIWLRAWVQEDEVLCMIRDEGIGIPREEQTRIFERFYQVDGSTKRRYEGMGLGLSIAKEVLEKHGGRIWVHSDGPNTGAAFTLALPIYHEESAA